MRLRGRIAYKLLTLLVTGAVILIICINYYSTSAAKPDPYLTPLPPLEEEQEIIAQPLADTDYVAHPSQLLNLSNFQYLLESQVCQKYKKDLLAILIVTSYAGHDELRAAHRQAISQSKLAEMGFQRVFLLAAVPPREQFITQQQLKNEQQRFDDLLQGNFHEAYRNLSYKHVMGLRWAAQSCERAKFIIKLDDDIIYDVFQLRRYLEALEVQQPKLTNSAALLAGYVLDTKTPVRNVANKWFVTRQEYALDSYPPYLSGWMYITNAATATRLVHEAHRLPIFWIDDTWLTGVVRKRLGIPMQRLNAWYSANAEFLDCCVRDLKEHNYECEYFVGPNGGDAKLLVEFLHNVEKCYFDECTKRAPEQSLKQTCVGRSKRLLPEHGQAQIEEVKLR